MLAVTDVVYADALQNNTAYTVAVTNHSGDSVLSSAAIAEGDYQVQFEKHPRC